MINRLAVQRGLRTFQVKFTDSPLQELSILSYLVYNKPGFQPSALWLISVIFQGNQQMRIYAHFHPRP